MAIIDDEDRIRARAYAIWEEEGWPDGRHREHWERACREIERENREAGADGDAAPVSHATLSGPGAMIAGGDPGPDKPAPSGAAPARETGERVETLREISANEPAGPRGKDGDTDGTRSGPTGNAGVGVNATGDAGVGVTETPNDTPEITPKGTPMKRVRREPRATGARGKIGRSGPLGT
ncbi:Protein of unknown function [Pseudoxanthobacter soli DSM 19599]|uniref:DUF2934 domain-containing protein n=1 Tax=Pseudoxanthobacter soli DSM 19599 TaxID=1123029 RepID=A0A1M7ZND7_9HYPH|nr:Protein of unknown function [Pseudoxanthobacter soli DSM 19599]